MPSRLTAMIAVSRLPIRRSVPDAACAAHDERWWVARARVGDEAAFAWLLNRYRNRAVRLASHVLRRDSEAEDVVQDAFIQAFKSLRSLSSDASFSTWLFRIVVRLSIDRTRSARWTRETGDDGQELAEASPASAIQTRIVVEQLLDRLTPGVRAALVLREIEGLEYDEIAKMLAIPVGTVRSRLHSARAQFRDLWLDACREED